MNKIKNFFGDGSVASDTAQIVGNTLGTSDEEQGNMCPALDWSTRVQGFFFTFGIGLILSLGGAVNLYMMNIPAFAILYSLGTIVSLFSSMFLRGPIAQIKSMTDKTRLVATGLMLMFTILTLISGLVLNQPGLTIICFTCQYISCIWYMLSYIPFARNAVKKCFGACIA